MPSIVGYTAPLLGAMAALLLVSGSSLVQLGEEEAPATPVPILAALLVLGLFAIAVSNVLLSGGLTGDAIGSPYARALRRFVPWLAAWVVVFVASTLGLLAVIIPGVIIGIRLFWADEFALIHGSSPIQAARDSWGFTRGRAFDLFVFQWLAGFASYITLLPLMVVAFLAHALIAGAGGGTPVATALPDGAALMLGLLALGSVHGAELA
jgi:hypothetical protein